MANLSKILVHVKQLLTVLACVKGSQQESYLRWLINLIKRN